MAEGRYFFRTKEGKVLSPVPYQKVVEMAHNGHVRANTPISVDGKEFKPMKSFAELASLLAMADEPPAQKPVEAVLNTKSNYSGSLTSVSFAKLLYHLIAAKSTGCLELISRQIRKNIYFQNGKPVAARSNLDRDQLGQHLVRAGLVTTEQLGQALGDLQDGKDRLGEWLIQKGTLTPHQLAQHLNTQFLEKLYEVFRN